MPIKNLLPIIILYICVGCQPKENTSALTEHKVDTSLRSDSILDLSQKRTDQIMDSAGVSGSDRIVMDAVLKINQLELRLNALKTDRKKIGPVDSLILETREGDQLFDVMMEVYDVGILKTPRESDRIRFKSMKGADKKLWLRNLFHNTSTEDALKNLHKLQEDVVLISAINAGVDDDATRLQIEKQYRQ